MDHLLAWLSQGLELAPGWAFLAAVGWGLASILLSPCHLASIPLVVGLLQRRDGLDGFRRSAGLGALFGLGVLASILGLGLAAALTGRLAGDLGSWLDEAVAILLVLSGLVVLEVLPLPAWGGNSLARGPGKRGAFSLGLVFGVGLGPCSFAFLAPILALLARSSAHDGQRGLLLLGGFSLGHCGLIALAGGAGGATRRYLSLARRGRWLPAFRGLCGGLLIVLGWAALLRG